MRWSDYFSFSRSQIRGVVVLLALNVLLWTIYFLLPFWVKPPDPAFDPDFSRKVEAFRAALNRDSLEAARPPELHPQPFDPNTADTAQLRSMGLREKLIRTLLNYRSKGGRFRHAEAFRGLYGLREEEFLQLKPFIRIAGEEARSFSLAPPEVVELNRADTAALNRIKGIGPRLAENIVRYRDQLGGFARVEQLREVYGMSDENYARAAPQCKVDVRHLKRIDLNLATHAELQAHPYLRGELATAIADFRRAHAYRIDSLAQLKEIPLMNAEIFRKIAPYLRVNKP